MLNLPPIYWEKVSFKTQRQGALGNWTTTKDNQQKCTWIIHLENTCSRKIYHFITSTFCQKFSDGRICYPHGLSGAASSSFLVGSHEDRRWSESRTTETQHPRLDGSNSSVVVGLLSLQPSTTSIMKKILLCSTTSNLSKVTHLY